MIGAVYGSSYMTWMYLLEAGDQECIQPIIPRVGSHAGYVGKEARTQLPVTVVQEGDHTGQQQIISFPAQKTNTCEGRHSPNCNQAFPYQHNLKDENSCLGAYSRLLLSWTVLNLQDCFSQFCCKCLPRLVPGPTCAPGRRPACAGAAAGRRA